MKEIGIKKYGILLAFLTAVALSLGLVFLTACGSGEESSSESSSDSSFSVSESDTADDSSDSDDGETEAEVLLTWTAAGTCTLECYVDGTYTFAFPDYGVSESGTWTWYDWAFTVTTPSGNEITATMDEDDYSLTLVYQSDISESLYDTFTLDATAWGTALGTTGEYSAS